MAHRFWMMVNKVMGEADILLLVLDARMVEETRNDEIEQKARTLGKPLIYCLNKCDLVDKHVMQLQKKRLHNSIFISAKDHLGTTLLRERIMTVASQHGFKSIKVGVLGYPNVGKSSVINALKGKGAAPSSSMSGYTRHIRKVRSSKIVLLDTPGVIPYSDTQKGRGHVDPGAKHAMIGSIDHTKEKDPDSVVASLLRAFPGLIEAHYGVSAHEDAEDTLDAIARKLSHKSKGGVPDMMRAARTVLKDWQTGQITPKKGYDR